MDGFVDTSGLFAVAGHRDAASLVVLGLHALQHRGTGGAGLAVADGNVVRSELRPGPVQQHLSSASWPAGTSSSVAWPAGALSSASWPAGGSPSAARPDGLSSAFRDAGGSSSDWPAGGFDPAAVEPLIGSMAVGQVFGRAELDAPTGEGGDGQRIAFGRHRGGPLAAAVSGRFTNGARLRRELLDAGALFQGPSDAELLLHLIAASSQRTVVNRIVDALFRVQGAYALLLLTEDHLIAVRDPSGFRPLVLGKLGEAHLLATEDGAVRFVGGEVRREVQAGEMLVVDGRGMVAVSPFTPREPRACAHEYVSLARADATVFGRATQTVRTALGERLGRVHPCPEADLVCAALGGEAAALGYARATRLPYEHALLSEPAVLQPLPEPPAGVPELGSRVRWRAIPAVVRDKTVVVVAPSLSTGRSLRKIVRLLREAGARGVHLRIASPPIQASCPYGVASPMPEELVSHQGDAGRSSTSRPADADGSSAASRPPGPDRSAGLRLVDFDGSSTSRPSGSDRSSASRPAGPERSSASRPADVDPAEVLGARSVAWLPLELLHEVVGSGDPQVRVVCDACFSHQLPLETEPGEDQLPLF